MRAIFFFILSFLVALPAWAGISCPSGMMLASTQNSPIPDCVCPGGQRPRMNITTDGKATTKFGSCPQVQTFLPKPSMSGNVASAHYGTWQLFRAPATAVYSIDAWGAQGGQSGAGESGGKGAWVHGEFPLTAGAEVSILVGQQGEDDPFTYSAGGGGGSFVVYNAKPLLVAGGGGGGSNVGGQPGKDATSPGSGTTTVAQSTAGGWKNMPGASSDEPPTLSSILSGAPIVSHVVVPDQSFQIVYKTIEVLGISIKIPVVVAKPVIKPTVMPPLDNAPSTPSVPPPPSAGTGICDGDLSIDGCGLGGLKEECGTGGGDGGFGGAGAGACNKNLAGSGGGYTGGNGTNPAPGGTSYIDASATNPASTAGVQGGEGKVVISW